MFASYGGCGLASLVAQQCLSSYPGPLEHGRGLVKDCEREQDDVKWNRRLSSGVFRAS